MSLEDFTILFNYLAQAYNKEPNETQLLIWYDFLKGYSKELIKNAIIECINEKTHFPSIAEIKEYIIKQNNTQVNLKADEEWEDVLRSVREYGYPREEEALKSLNPITRNIVKRIGFFEICMADENRKYNLRSSFIKAFDNEKEDLIRYEKSNNKDSLEMQLIANRNKNTLNRVISNSIVKKVDDLLDE